MEENVLCYTCIYTQCIISLFLHHGDATLSLGGCNNCKFKLSSPLHVYAERSQKSTYTSCHAVTTVKMLYYSLFYPHVIIYGVLLWGSTYQSHLNKIITSQKRAVRVLSGAERSAHTNELFHNLKY